jgi:hypothetical protein
MIIGERDTFEIGDPVVDHDADDGRIGLVTSIEQSEDGETVLVVRGEENPRDVWRILDRNAGRA